MENFKANRNVSIAISWKRNNLLTMVDDIKKPFYLDYNATTPHDPSVVAAMTPFLEEYFGNPSSSHWYGVQTKAAVEMARTRVASFLNCKPSEIVFTSGGTESNNYAIEGVAFSRQDQGNHIITSQIEHPAVIEVCKFLEEHGFKVSYLPVDESGLVSIPTLEQEITPQTILITIMHANNEVGTIQPIEQITRLARKKGIVVHTDAAQSAGKIVTDVNELNVDLLSIAGHKIYAPKGVGALFIRQGVQLQKFMHGAGHESGRRAGTENILGIVGLGKACEIAKRDLTINASHMKAMRDSLYEGLKERVEVKVNGHPEMRLPNTLSVSFKGIDANTLLSRIAKDVAASAGSACHSGKTEISSVLKAMNAPVEVAQGTVRFSVGKMTTENEIEAAINAIAKAVGDLKK